MADRPKMHFSVEQCTTLSFVRPVDDRVKTGVFDSQFRPRESSQQYCASASSGNWKFEKLYSYTQFLILNKYNK